MLIQDYTGHIVAAAQELENYDIGIKYKSIETFAETFKNKELLAQVRENMWKNRTFSALIYVDDLIQFFRDVIKSKQKNGLKNRVTHILLLLFVLCNLYAQEKITGHVTDLNEKPLEGAIVMIADIQSNKTLHTSITDSSGNYTISLPLEKSLLLISALGYELYTTTISAIPTKEVLISRLEDKMIELNDVVIEASAKARMRHQGNKFVIDKIENSVYAKGSDAFTFLRFVPVLNVPVFEGEITVKGGQTASLHINGRRTHLPVETLLKSIRAEDIERIEIVVHPDSGYNEQSIINILMKRNPNEGIKSFLTFEDRHRGVNQQYLSYSLSYSSNKTFITSGLFINHIHHNRDHENSFRYYSDNLLTNEQNKGRDRILRLSGYFNMDYVFNEKNILGMRVSANGRNQNNKRTGTTMFGNLSEGSIDSIYTSINKTTSPSIFEGLNINFNYNFKTDDKGSEFLADIDYIMTRPQTEHHAIFEKDISGIATKESDFKQRNQTQVDAFGIWGRYNYIFTSSAELNSGISLSGALGDYKDLYSTHQQGDYINDPTRTNNLRYDDITLAAYTSFQKRWNDKFMTQIGVRLESYHAKGTQKESEEKIAKHNTNLSPSILLHYTPSDNHGIVINASHSVARPRYHELNPFKTFLSPTTYAKGNPDLKVSQMYKGGISYIFFDDFTFDLHGMFVDKISTLFTIPDENNLIMITPINYGKFLIIVPSFSASKSLFKERLYLSGDINYIYHKYKGSAGDIEIDLRTWAPNISLSTNIILDKKKTVSSFINYSYDGASKDAASFSYAEQIVQMTLIKVFMKSRLLMGFDKQLKAKNKTYYEAADYGYTKIHKNYWSLYLTYSITLGKSNVRSVHGRANEDISGRF